MPQLKWLHIGSTAITNDVAATLIALENLKYLNISQTKIDEDTFYDIEDQFNDRDGLVVGP